MDTARSVEENGCEVNVSVGCKAECKSITVTPLDCLSLLCIHPHAQMWTATFVEEVMPHYAGNEKTG